MQSFSEWESEFKKWQKITTTKVIGKHIVLLPEIPSTNVYVKDNLQLQHGTIVAAHQQTRGKGQKNRIWISNPGGLYFTLKVDIFQTKTFSPFWITATVSIGLCKALNQLGLNAKIKWPNDILVNGRKVAGILTETVMTNNTITAIIGIGCNINNDLGEIFAIFPELETKISSLGRELKQSTPLSFIQILEETLSYVETKLLLFENLNITAIKKEWLEYSNIIGKKIELEKIDTREIIRGTVTKVTDFGSLMVKKDSNQEEEFTSGEIKIIA